MNRLTALPLLSLVLCLSASSLPALAWEEKPITAEAPAAASPPIPQTVAPLAPPAKMPAAAVTSQGTVQTKKAKPPHYKKSSAIEATMARDVWLDRSATADPSILASICSNRHAAYVLAHHPHLDKVADADHYLCRRLTKWHGASWALVSNPHADHVIALDPEGIYRAIRCNPGLAIKLAHHPMFNQMITDNPELGVEIARHM